MKTYADAAREAHAALIARSAGEWDSPALTRLGPLFTRESDDILRIKRMFLDDCGFTISARDPEINRKYPGRFMVCECYDEKTGQTDDGSDGPWTLVGDDLDSLIEEAFDFFADCYPIAQAPA